MDVGECWKGVGVMDAGGVGGLWSIVVDRGCFGWLVGWLVDWSVGG